jgi:6-phosphogluconolactonase
VPVPESSIHRVHSENPNADEAARQYEQTLLQLDLILLGLGPDGHTASIFPGSEVLHETKRLVAAPWVEKFNSYRITMTLPLLNSGAVVLFLVSGAEKAGIVKEVLEGPKKYPAQFVQPTHGQLLWMLDKDAADERE